MGDLNWEDNAVRYRLSGYLGVSYDVFIEQRAQLDKSIKWVVLLAGSTCLTKKAECLYEPMPSSRTEDFISQTRFDTKEEAFETLLKVKNKL